MQGVVDLRQCGKSLTYNRNNRGPRIEPLGTPQVIIFLDDSVVESNNPYNKILKLV